jgi:hypothetical protein
MAVMLGYIVLSSQLGNVQFGSTTEEKGQGSSCNLELRCRL